MRKYWRVFISILEDDPHYRYIDNPEPMEEKKRLIAQEKEEELKPTYNKPRPVCGEGVIRDEYEICPVCGWFLDPIQSEDPDCEEGANRSTINQAKEAFHKLRENDPTYRWDNDPGNLSKKLMEITGQFD